MVFGSHKYVSFIFTFEFLGVESTSLWTSRRVTKGDDPTTDCPALSVDLIYIIVVKNGFTRISTFQRTERFNKNLREIFLFLNFQDNIQNFI